MYNLDFFLKEYTPDLIFLSEPQAFSCDIDRMLTPFDNVYRFEFNGEDKFDADLPLTKLKAKGGTMALWHARLHPYVTVLETPSPSIIALMLKPPMCVPSVHIGVYLPTSGLEPEFMDALATLDTLIFNQLDMSDGNYPIFRIRSMRQEYLSYLTSRKNFASKKHLLIMRHIIILQDMVNLTPVLMLSCIQAVQMEPLKSLCSRYVSFITPLCKAIMTY